VSPFIETLAQLLALVGGLAGVGAMIWGAARRQRGREAIDEQHAAKLTALSSSSSSHADKCDESHATHKTELTALDRRVMRIELEVGIDPPT
jgi:hypothetical protein